MMTDLEQVESIVGAASGRTIGNELTFAFPEVSEVIGLCTQNEIAVLGVEVLDVRPDGYYTKSLSVYDLKMGSGPKRRDGWIDYVHANNTLADKFVKSNPFGDDHIYVLTAASWREFQQLKLKMRDMRS